jgi:hypothetical protein
MQGPWPAASGRGLAAERLMPSPRCGAWGSPRLVLACARGHPRGFIRLDTRDHHRNVLSHDPDGNLVELVRRSARRAASTAGSRSAGVS